jgi:Flp pilus assembly protein TadG
MKIPEISNSNPFTVRALLNAGYRLMTRKDGSVFVLTVLFGGILLGVLAFAIDVGQLLYTRRQLQSVANAAALSAALELQQCGSTPACTLMQTAASQAAIENNFPTATVYTQCNFNANSQTGMTLVVNNGPCALGTSDPNHGLTTYVEVIATIQQKTMFGAMLGVRNVMLGTRAEATLGPPSACVTILDSNASQAFLFNGGATVSAPCGITVNSNSGTAFEFNGGSLTANYVNVVGGDMINNGGSGLNATVKTGASAVTDPLASLPVPTIGACGTSTSSPYHGVSYGALLNSGASTFFPGVYCGGITLNANATATFNPGLYIINGPVVIGASDTVTGSGVTFYFENNSWTSNGAASMNLTAPTTGTYAGILFFQAHGDTDTFILDSNTTSVAQGTFYLPDGPLTINGGANLAAYELLDVHDLTVDSGVNLVIGTNYSSLPNGSPLGAASAQAILTE